MVNVLVEVPTGEHGHLVPIIGELQLTTIASVKITVGWQCIYKKQINSVFSLWISLFQESEPENNYWQISLYLPLNHSAFLP